MPIMLFLFVLCNIRSRGESTKRQLSIKLYTKTHWHSHHNQNGNKTHVPYHTISYHAKLCNEPHHPEIENLARYICRASRAQYACVSYNRYRYSVWLWGTRYKLLTLFTNCKLSFRCIWFLNWLLNLLTHNRNIATFILKQLASMQPNHTVIVCIAIAIVTRPVNAALNFDGAISICNHF